MSEPLTNGDLQNKSTKSQKGVYSSLPFMPREFLQMIYIDASDFDRHHYKFDYFGREFLGEVRCLVFDVTPQGKSGKGNTFLGRIWVEDQGNHIVRFNGAFTGSSSTNSYFHFDSWRVNSGGNQWLPALIYSEEGDMRSGAPASWRSRHRPACGATTLVTSARAGSKQGFHRRPNGRERFGRYAQ